MKNYRIFTLSSSHKTDNLQFISVSQDGVRIDFLFYYFQIKLYRHPLVIDLIMFQQLPQGQPFREVFVFAVDFQLHGSKYPGPDNRLWMVQLSSIRHQG